jgi:CheY-like chemotaxis protein
LTKPVKQSELYNVLLDLFDGRESRVERSVRQSSLEADLAQRHPLRILLVEDNPVNQKVALHILKRLGYRADVAGNGLEALEAVERQRYDLVLMDVQMPELDGLEATRRICARWPRAERPYVIGMTANAMPEDREQCLAAGMDDYLSKPVQVPSLVEALGRGYATNGRCDVGPECSQPGAAVLPISLPGKTVPPSPANPVLEPSALRELQTMVGEDAPEIYVQVIQSYLETAPQLLAEMGQALAGGKAPVLLRAAHTLKSSSALLGAVELSDLCRAMEIVAKTGDLRGLAETVAQTQAEYERVKTALELEQFAEMGGVKH